MWSDLFLNFIAKLIKACHIQNDICFLLIYAYILNSIYVVGFAENDNLKQLSLKETD